jgi:hypothetical protein
MLYQSRLSQPKAPLLPSQLLGSPSLFVQAVFSAGVLTHYVTHKRVDGVFRKLDDDRVVDSPLAIQPPQGQCAVIPYPRLVLFKLGDGSPVTSVRGSPEPSAHVAQPANGLLSLLLLSKNEKSRVTQSVLHSTMETETGVFDAQAALMLRSSPRPQPCDDSELEDLAIMSIKCLYESGDSLCNKLPHTFFLVSCIDQTPRSFPRPQSTCVRR